MQIHLKRLTDIVGKTDPLTPWVARSIISRFYCGKLTLANTCTGDCERLCKSSLVSITKDLIGAGNPAALVTWRSKNETTKMIEQTRDLERHEPVKKPEIFGEVKPKDNPFEALLDSL